VTCKNANTRAPGACGRALLPAFYGTASHRDLVRKGARRSAFWTAVCALSGQPCRQGSAAHLHDSRRYRRGMRLSTTPDEQRLLAALTARPVLLTVAVTLVLAVLVSLWQPIVGGVIFAVGLLAATQVAVRIGRNNSGG
jgi:hypothetical protein